MRKIYFEKLPHAIVGLAKCKIDKAGQRAGNSGRMFLLDNLEAEFLFLEISAFGLKAFS